MGEKILRMIISCESGCYVTMSHVIVLCKAICLRKRQGVKIVRVIWYGGRKWSRLPSPPFMGQKLFTMAQKLRNSREWRCSDHSTDTMVNPGGCPLWTITLGSLHCLSNVHYKRIIISFCSVVNHRNSTPLPWAQEEIPLLWLFQVRLRGIPFWMVSELQCWAIDVLDVVGRSVLVRYKAKSFTCSISFSLHNRSLW